MYWWIPEPAGVDSLRGICDFCAAKGYLPEVEAIRVGAWPVQFIPVFSPLTREAMEQAETADFEGDHLAVIALSVGRAKDCARILALLESDAVRREDIEALAARHGLTQEWQRFARRFLDD